ncbi:MAG: PAS domain S-box protein [Anaerolineales bacterium]|nr:PAS domain S-box protein [Anaerolineales bacterium]
MALRKKPIVKPGDTKKKKLTVHVDSRHSGDPIVSSDAAAGELEALRESEDRYRLFQGILQSSSDGILAVNRENEVLFANQRFVEMWMIPKTTMAKKDDTLLLQYVLDQLSDPQGFLDKVQELYNSAEESIDTLNFKDGRAFERLSRPLQQGTELHGRVWSFRDITEGKRAEEALRESEERYRSLFDRMMDGVYRSTHEGRFVDVNPAMVKMFGYSSREEMLKVDIRKEFYFAPEERGSHVLDTGQEEMEVYRMRRKDGSVIWVEDHGSYVHDQQGRVIYHEGMLRDITDRKQIEDALLASEAELRTLFASMHDVVLVIDREGVYRKIAPTNPGLLVKPPEELLGKNLKDVFPVEEAEVFRIAMQQVLDTKQNSQIEYELVINGQTMWFQTSISPLDEDSTLWVAHDITERKQVEEALGIAEANYRSIFENATVGIYQSTPQGRFLSVNPVMAHIFGYVSPEQMLSNITSIENQFYVDPADRHEFQRLMMEQGQVKKFFNQFRHKDGSHIWVQENARAVKDVNGSILHYEGFITDITERKQAEEALNISEARYRTLVEQIPAVVYIDKATGDPSHSLYVSPRIETLLGITPHGWLQEDVNQWADHIHPDDRQRTKAEYLRSIQNGEEIDSEYRMIATDGRLVWIHDQTMIIRKEDGSPSLINGVMYDITDRKQVEDELRRAKEGLETVNLELQQSLEREKLLASTDGLTGLCNHRHLFELAAREFQSAVRYRRPLTFLMFDMDDFKQVNDTLGHAAGDQLLVKVAQTAVAQVRVPDVVARYDGDEFIVLLPNASAQQALPVADRIRAQVAALRIGTDNIPFTITLSIGIAEMRHEPLDENVERIIQRADEALYQAKESGRNRTVIFGQDEAGTN